MIGFDMTAVLAMSNAVGLSPALVCEVMPALEAKLTEAHNLESEDHGRKAGISPDQG
jgi:hypothetical protein